MKISLHSKKTNKIRCEGCKLYNFVNGCVKPILTHPFTYGLLMSLGYLPRTPRTIFLISVLRVKGCLPPKILVQVKACLPPKRGDLCVITHFLILNLNTGVTLKQ
ncbi:hypothetical protein GIB67_032665, partial [Kingdonia uniflora]